MHMIRMAVSGLGIGLNVNHYMNFAGQNSRNNNGNTEGEPSVSPLFFLLFCPAKFT